MSIILSNKHNTHQATGMYSAPLDLYPSLLIKTIAVYVLHSLFLIHENNEDCPIPAGFLTFSLYLAFPDNIQWHKVSRYFQQYGKRLQQRALFRIFTGFPHISYRKYEIHQNRCEDIIFYNEFLEK